MAKQVINIGTYPSDGTGDPLRVSFNKINQNFTELYTLTGGDASTLTELAQDYAASMFTNGAHSNIAVEYDDVNNKINLSVPAGFSGNYGDLTDTPVIPVDIADLTDNNSLLSSGADLGQFKIVNNILGTIDNPDTGHWGGYDMLLSPGGGGGSALLYIPSIENQVAGLPVQLHNTSEPTSLVQLFGRGGVQVSTNIGAKEQVFEFGTNGTLSSPTLFPSTFTAVVDAAHYAGVGTLTLSSDAWRFEVSFVVGSDGTVTTNITNETPWENNPGYSDGMQFEFAEADHGIPGYTFTLTLLDIQNPGPAGWTTNLAASIPPTVPATIQKTDAIKLTAGSANWTFNSNGSLKLASGNGTIVSGGGTWHLDSANGDFTFPNSSRISYGLNNLGLTEDDLKIQAINTGNVQISSAGGTHNWTFGNAGQLTLPGGTSELYSVAGEVYLYSDAGGGQSGIDMVTNGDTILRNQRHVKIISASQGSAHTWTFGNDGSITFPDSTVQNTAYTGSTGDGIKYTSTLDAFSGDFTVASEQLVLVYNNGVASRTIYLPLSPSNGQTVTIKKSAAFTSWTVVVNGNGKNIDGAASISFNNSWGYITLTYSTANSYNHWFVVGGNYSTV